MNPSDTLAALATPVGTSAVALIRLSGPQALGIVQAILGRRPTPRRATYGEYKNASGERVDDVVFTTFAGPHSYTGEDSAEISCHGNPFIAQTILEDLYARGCRPAEPGEFTRRAFLNGKMDLSQAEAVIDIIHARSERALRVAGQQLKGSLTRRMGALVDELLALAARVEAYIDFPEEDLPAEDKQDVEGRMTRIAEQLERLLATQRYGDLLRDGVRTVILGEPNAGKSSLLNRLVGQDRALVSPEPGTTRDFIEERMVVGQHVIRLIDTAGLNPSPAPLERLGIEKTMERIDEADLYLLVYDAARPFPNLPSRVQTLLNDERTLVVANKSDLPSVSQSVDNKDVISVSALTGQGFNHLIQQISAKVERYNVDHGSEAIAINARHGDALRRAKEALARALECLGSNAPMELLASELRECRSAVGEITGHIDNERVLDHLFSTFCIGK